MKHLLTSFAALLVATTCASAAPRAATCTPVRKAPRAFPRRISTPALPSALAPRDWWRGMDDMPQLSADVRLCVTPDGKTTGVRLHRSSGSAEYDRAIVREVAGWRYEPFTGEASLPACELATVRYAP